MKLLFLIKFFTLCLFAMGQSLPNQLDSIFDGFEINNSAAHALLVVQNGEVVYQRVVGLADHEHQIAATSQSNFRMASVAKQFTTAAILLLEKQGKVSLEHTLSDFFPGFASCGKSITLRHLLTHTSGIVDYEEIMPAHLDSQLMDADVLNMVKNYEKTYFLAGSEFRYSNTGFCLLALVAERVSGQGFAEFVEHQIFMPLGMTNSRVFEPGEHIPNRAFGYVLDEQQQLRFSDQSLTSATKGDGGLYVSLDDFEKWSRLRQEKLGIDFASSLPDCSAALPSMLDSYYGLGWFFIQKEGLPLTLFHTGSTCGFSNVVVEIPEEKTMVVFFTNLASYHDAFKPVYELLERGGVVHREIDVWELHERTR